MNTPVLIRVRKRRTDHGAESLSAVANWIDAYDARRREPTRSETADFGWRGVERDRRPLRASRVRR